MRPLLLALLLLAYCVPLPRRQILLLNILIVFVAVDGLLGTAISNHQGVVVAEQLVVVDAAGGNAHVRGVVAAVEVLAVRTVGGRADDGGGGVDHVVLGLRDVATCAHMLLRRVVLVVGTILTTAVARVLLSLHHAFRVYQRVVLTTI